MVRSIALWVVLVLALAAPACEDDRPVPKVAADASRLKAATDVFWALQNLGFMVVKDKPNPTKHGCKPFEYLAQKGPAEKIQARFRISVFECPSAEKATEIVENEHTRHVDALLRDAHEGGVLRRQALEIIVRREQGQPADTDGLLQALGNM